jgi:hypothetical protein
MLSNLPAKNGRPQITAEPAQLKVELVSEANLPYEIKSPTALRRLLQNKLALVCLGYLALLRLAGAWGAT